MRLQNIHNRNRLIYKFIRENDNTPRIEKDNDFYPFYYEPDENGEYIGYDGVKLKKILTSSPSDIPEQRSLESYSSNIIYTKNYLIHKVDKIEESPTKYFFIDIEVLSDKNISINELQYKANKPITCITLYNSLYKSIQTWWIKDMKGDSLKEQEAELLRLFIEYIKKESPDIILAWNISFDYNYLHKRYKYFANAISPINQSRRSEDRNVFYPAGISILDYLKLFKKVSMREQSYALDNIAQKYLNDKSWGKQNFSVLDDSIRDKNIHDVERMVKIEEKFKIIDYFDAVRRLAKVEWESLYYNSFIIESLLFTEAKIKNVVLPNGPNRSNITKDETFKGAAREAIQTGALFNITKFDLSSAYPSMIVNFCLDPQNISSTEGIKIENTRFIQKEDSLCPAMVKKILTIKDKLKKELLSKVPDSPEHKQAKINYNAIKGIVNSSFGIFGLPIFRLYDNRVASAIAYLVRDLLLYVVEKLENIGIKVIYYDTDGIFTDCSDDISDVLNDLIKDWAKKYNKDNIDIEFNYEGYFSKLFILTKCRYVGDLVTDKGVEHEIKGLEIKRGDASKYSKNFQKEIINRILDKQNQDEIIEWINEEKNRIKTLSLSEIAFPCKINKDKYKVKTQFVRAYENRKEIDPDFHLDIGELYYYIFVNSTQDKKKNVIAFKDNENFTRTDVNWDEMIRRNIILKAESIFDAMKWDKNKLYNIHQATLF